MIFKKKSEKNKEKETKEESQTLIETLNKFRQGKDNKYEPPLPEETLELIRKDLKRKYSRKILKGVKDDEIKKELIEHVIEDYPHHLSKNNDKKREQAEHVIREIVGTGIIEAILESNNAITDIGWNGTHLSLETNNEKVLIEGSELGITNRYVERVIQKYARLNNKEFNDSDPIMDGMIKNIRLSTIHSSISPDGATFSLRVTRPRLALNEENFNNFAPPYILELLQKIVLTNANVFISGETGTGKTELQKLLLGFVEGRERIIMIEDVRETHIKKLFPFKDIYSWVTGKKSTISDLTAASLRNNPRWIVVSETRGKEAYEMLQAILSGHKIISTLHAVDARAIPRRFINMCSMGYEINESMVQEDFERYVDFGVHIERLELDGKVIRYLDEIVEYSPYGATTIFKQDYDGFEGKFICQNGELSDAFKRRMAKKALAFEFPKENSIARTEETN